MRRHAMRSISFGKYSMFNYSPMLFSLVRNTIVIPKLTFNLESVKTMKTNKKKAGDMGTYIKKKRRRKMRPQMEETRKTQALRALDDHNRMEKLMYYGENSQKPNKQNI